MPKTLVKDGTSLKPDAEDDKPIDEELLNGAAPQPAAVLPFMAALGPAGELGSREEIQEELDGIAAQVRRFHVKQPDLVMRECSAYSARLTELCVLLHRVETVNRQYTRLRTQQVQVWLAELDRQYKIASRMVEISRQDLELLKG